MISISDQLQNSFFNRTGNTYQVDLTQQSYNFVWNELFTTAQARAPVGVCQIDASTYALFSYYGGRLQYKHVTDLTSWDDTGWTDLDTATIPTWWKCGVQNYSTVTAAGIVYGMRSGDTLTVRYRYYDGSNWDNYQDVDSWTESIGDNQQVFIATCVGNNQLIFYQRQWDIYIATNDNPGTTAWATAKWDLVGGWANNSVYKAPMPNMAIYLAEERLTKFIFSAVPTKYDTNGMVAYEDGIRFYQTDYNQYLSDGETHQVGLVSDYQITAEQSACILCSALINDTYFLGVTMSLVFPDNRAQPRRNFLIASNDGEHWTKPLVFMPSVSTNTLVPFAILADDNYLYIYGSDFDDGYKMKVFQCPLNGYTGGTSESYTDKVSSWQISKPDGGQAAQLTFDLGQGFDEVLGSLSPNTEIQVTVGVNGSTERVSAFTGFVDSAGYGMTYDSRSLSFNVLDKVSRLKQPMDIVLAIPSQITQTIDFANSDAPDFIDLAGNWYVESGSFLCTYDLENEIAVSLEAGVSKYGRNELNSFALKFNHYPQDHNITEYAGMCFRTGYSIPADGNAGSIDSLTYGYAILVEPQMDASGWTGTTKIYMAHKVGPNWIQVSAGLNEPFDPTDWIYVQFQSFYNKVWVWVTTDPTNWGTGSPVEFEITSTSLPQGELGFVAKINGPGVGEDLAADPPVYGTLQTVYFDDYSNHTMTTTKNVDYLCRAIATKNYILDVDVETTVDTICADNVDWEYSISGENPQVVVDVDLEYFLLDRYSPADRGEIVYNTVHPSLPPGFLISWNGTVDGGIIQISASDTSFSDGYLIDATPNGGHSTGSFEVYRDGVSDFFMRSAWSIESDTFYNFLLSCYEGWISMWVDGRLAFTYYDDNYSEKDNNYWGFVCDNGGPKISHVCISALNGSFGQLVINPSDTTEGILQGLVRTFYGGAYSFSGDGRLQITKNTPINYIDVWNTAEILTLEDELIEATGQRDWETLTTTVRITGQDGLYFAEAHDDTLAATYGYYFYQENIPELDSNNACQTRAEELLDERNSFLNTLDFVGMFLPFLEISDRIHIDNQIDGTDSDFIINSLTLSGDYETAEYSTAINTTEVP